MRHFYGSCAIVLGVWEAVAYTTKRVPTITAFMRPRRHPVVRLLMIAWMLGLARHLMRVES